MKNITSKIGKFVLCMALPLGTAQGFLSSCSDYLYIKPLNEIVEENYWDRKEDVESILYGCYSGMQEPDFMKRVFLWGEARSENVTYASQSTETELRYIVGENILETNKYLKWKDFYQVINRCNTLIYNAPNVQAIDPNYSENDMNVHIAEATWIRTLCYFYLVRTFRDVPYTNKPSVNDKNIEEDYALPPVPMDEMLKILSSDLEAVMNNALRYFPLERYGHALNNPSNTSRVTKCAFYALLCDIYLWQGEWQKVIEYSDKVFQYKMALYEDAKAESERMVEDIELSFNKYPLYTDKFQSGKIYGYSYNKIFGEGNSFESIFELYFEDQKSTTNEIVKTFFVNPEDGRVGQFMAPPLVFANIYSKDNKIYNATDFRPVSFFLNDETTYPITKYYYYDVRIEPNPLEGKDPTPHGSSFSKAFANWIVYRLTDVMLMRAEALIQLGTDEQMAEAFELISAVYNRGNALKPTDEDCLKAEDYPSKEDMLDLVLLERNRELLFEGKHWFDWVRFTLREKDNQKMIQAVTTKQKERKTAVQIQLRPRDALFWPYEKDELKINKHLKQNSAYITNETTQR